ncbi:MAG TPA: hypothetical protein VHH36_01665, partial [Candidatus Thermoplasmatota archaeon]|nr:hypothetical protein [Candidatus Thermoplasmatota archaeon]
MAGCVVTKEFVVPLENAPGSLADALAAAQAAGARIVALATETRGEFGLARIVADPEAAARRGLHAAGLHPHENDALLVLTSDAGGALARLAASGVDVRASYFAGGALAVV